MRHVVEVCALHPRHTISGTRWPSAASPADAGLAPKKLVGRVSRLFDNALRSRGLVSIVAMDSKRHLQDADPEMFALLREEKQRQVTGLELIASEVR